MPPKQPMTSVPDVLRCEKVRTPHDTVHTTNGSDQHLNDHPQGCLTKFAVHVWPTLQMRVHQQVCVHR